MRATVGMQWRQLVTLAGLALLGMTVAGALRSLVDPGVAGIQNPPVLAAVPRPPEAAAPALPAAMAALEVEPPLPERPSSPPPTERAVQSLAPEASPAVQKVEDVRPSAPGPKVRRAAVERRRPIELHPTVSQRSRSKAEPMRLTEAVPSRPDSPMAFAAGDAGQGGTHPTLVQGASSDPTEAAARDAETAIPSLAAPAERRQAAKARSRRLRPPAADTLTAQASDAKVTQISPTAMAGDSAQ